MAKIEIDIRTKAIVFLEFTIMTFLSRDPRFLAALLIITCILAFLVQLPWKKVYQLLLPLLPLLLLIQICTALNLAHFAMGGFSLGLTYTLRILIFILISLIIQHNTSQADLMQLFYWLKLPREISFLILTSLRFIPALNKKRLQIIDAQRARGSFSHHQGVFQSIRSFIPIVIPLFAGSIQMANTLAIAMVSRGFGYSKIWTPEDKTSFKLLDYFLLILFSGFFLTAVYYQLK